MDHQDWHTTTFPKPKTLIPVKAVHKDGRVSAASKLDACGDIPTEIKKKVLVGKRLVQARTAKGMNQKTFANLFNISEGALKLYETDKEPLPGHLKDKIQRALKLKLS